MCNNILFILVILGCDTTSRVHGIGKGASLKNFLVSHHFRDQAQLFNITSASKKDVVAAGQFCFKLARNERHISLSSLHWRLSVARRYSLNSLRRLGPRRLFVSPSTGKCSIFSDFSLWNCLVPSIRCFYESVTTKSYQ